jgi:two-component system cell cycle sensor histidine kinase/response regulator CckA
MSMEGLDRFWELVPEMLVIYDAQGEIQRANAAWISDFGVVADDLVGRHLLELVSPDDHPLAAELLDSTVVSLRARPLQLRMRTAHGRPRTFEWSAVHDSRTGLFYGAARDVSESIDVSGALRQSAERYRELFESHPVAMAVWDPETHEVLAVNDAAVRQYGYSRDEIVDLTVERIVHPDDLARLAESVPRFSRGVDGGAPFRHIRKDGSTLQVEVTGHDLEYGGRPARLVMAMDVTERRSLEAQLREAQKMEAVGRLAGGIAHDFNNLLTAILGYGRMLIDSLDDDDPRRDDALQIRAVGERAAAMTGQLLAFSRADMIQPTTFDLNAAIRDVVPAISGFAGSVVDLELSLSAVSPWIRGDRTRVGQLVVDLATNALEAMPDGGRLRIATSELDAADTRAARLGIDASVVLVLTDNGSGIAPALRDRIFEPFFTTKPPGQGTGLGLATAYATVRQAGGQIRVDSEPGTGTSVHVGFPIVAAPVSDAPMVLESARALATRATILVAEDEPAVRELVVRLLKTAGYDVVAAEDGSSALALAESHSIDLVLSDIVMPGMNGRELARELRLREPELPVLLMSGYSDQRETTEDGTPIDLLVKPFEREELLGRVGRLLAASQPH